MYILKLFKTNLCLPHRLRPLLALAPPRSRLIAGLEELRRLRYTETISVGDRVTRSLIEAGITPWIAIYDCKERRSVIRCPELGPEREEIIVRNPRSSITLEAVRAITAAASRKEPSSIRIIGEEDMLALVAILAAPVGSHVVYGVPGIGMADIIVDNIHKGIARSILLELEPCTSPLEGKKE